MTCIFLIIFCLAQKVHSSDLNIPHLQDKSLQIYSDFKSIPYNESLSSDLSLLDQISRGTCLGRHTEQQERFNPCTDGKNYLLRQGDNFKDSLNLGKEIKQYFDYKQRSTDALYRYSLYQDQNISPKGIVINYYGGFFGDFFDNGSIRSMEQFIVKNEYIVINLQTRDNWQTIPQWEQFQTLPGKELLQDTLMSLFLFTKAVREKYSSLPIYYKGASFGGAKGALANLVLSNKGNLMEIFKSRFQKFAKSLEDELNQYAIDESLFQGYILHDGVYSVFSSCHVLQKYYTKLPMLLLHNFDDERVVVNDVLKFYKSLKEEKSLDENIRLFIVPQGAASFLQKAEIGCLGNLMSALDAHRAPELLKYRKDYNERVLGFLAKPKGESQLSPALNMVRYTHASQLLNNQDHHRTMLYRLYYANLHAEPKTSRALILERLNKTFSQYTRYCADNGNALTIYQDLISEHSAWLIDTIIDKNRMWYKYFVNLVKQIKSNNSSQNNLLSTSSPSRFHLKGGLQNETQTYSHFYLTENARDFLKTNTNSISLLESAKQHSIIIDTPVLKFFNSNSAKLDLEDIQKLWKVSNFPLIDNLQNMSRYISLINQIGAVKKKDQAKLFSMLLSWNTEDILLKLFNRRLNLESYQLIMAGLLKKKDEEEKHNILSVFVDLLPANEGTHDVIKWIFKLSKENRSKISQKYLQIKTLLYRNSLGISKILELFRELSERDILNLSFEKDVSGFIEDIRQIKGLKGDKLLKEFLEKIDIYKTKTC